MDIFLSFDQFQWWNDFLEDPDKYVKQQLRWPLLKLKKKHHVLDIPQQVLENAQLFCIKTSATIPLSGPHVTRINQMFSSLSLTILNRISAEIEHN